MFQGDKVALLRVPLVAHTENAAALGSHQIENTVVATPIHALSLKLK